MNHFILTIDDDGDPSIHAVTPAAVLVVSDVKNLQHQLDVCSDPVKNGVIKNTPKDRRRYVERILPALRFYCHRFGIEAPDWLSDNTRWEELSDEERAAAFGPGDLKLREFTPVNVPDIAVQREEQT